NLHRLSGAWSDSNAGPWTANEKYFLFSSRRNDRNDVWAVSEEHGFFGLRNPRPIPLTAGPLDIGGWALSPDGRRLFLEASEGHRELLRYDMGSKQFLTYLLGVLGGGLGLLQDGLC